MSEVQTIAANQNAKYEYTSISHKTEQGDYWAVDFIILSVLGKDVEITMEVSNDNLNWFCFKLINYKISRTLGASIKGNSLPFDWVRFKVSSGNSGNYKILFNERK